VDDLDLLSPLIQRAKFRLIGKPGSDAADARDFARALLSAVEELERLRGERDRLVKEYARALMDLCEAPRGDA
jgi:hypothetical protein